MDDATLLDYAVQEIARPHLADAHEFQLKTFKINKELEQLEEVGDLFVDTLKINDLR